MSTDNVRALRRLIALFLLRTLGVAALVAAVVWTLPLWSTT